MVGHCGVCEVDCFPPRYSRSQRRSWACSDAKCGPAARAPIERRVVSGWIASRHIIRGRKDCARGRKDTVPSLRAFRPWPFIVYSDTASYSNGVSILITPWLDAFFSVKPDSTFPAQLVSFGTSGHRGSSLSASFNELHILAIAQAVVDYRLQAGITGPLFIGLDTHALSRPAWEVALQVLMANQVAVRVAQDEGVTATPLVSRAIVSYNAQRTEDLDRKSVVEG